MVNLETREKSCSLSSRRHKHTHTDHSLILWWSHDHWAWIVDWILLLLSIQSCHILLLSKYGYLISRKCIGNFLKIFVGLTVNQEFCLTVLWHVWEAAQKKLSDLWQEHSWLLHRDNTPMHTVLCVQKFLITN